MFTRNTHSTRRHSTHTHTHSRLRLKGLLRIVGLRMVYYIWVSPFDNEKSLSPVLKPNGLRPLNLMSKRQMKIVKGAFEKWKVKRICYKLSDNAKACTEISMMNRFVNALGSADLSHMVLD